MNARRSPTNRTAGGLLPVVVASLLLAFCGLAALAGTMHAPAGVAGNNPAISDAAVVPLQAFPLLAQSVGHSSQATCEGQSVTAPGDSAAAHCKRRVFVEGTTSPSLEALKTARLQYAMKPVTATPAASPALRNASLSVANRQRAP